MKPNWDELLADLIRHQCRCGSGGGMACDDDCPGDIRDEAMLRAIIALIQTVRS